MNEDGRTAHTEQRERPKKEFSLFYAVSAAGMLPFALLLPGLVFRLAYGHDLPLNPDEEGHLRLARSLSIRPVHLPLGSEITNHLILAVYITALADWVGGVRALLSGPYSSC